MIPAAFKIISRHRYLLAALVKRDIIGRYRGSALGSVWSLFEPLVLLGIYTLVFGVMMEMGGGGGIGGYSLMVFCGILPWLAFSETLNRSTTVLWENTTLVKKIIFPQEVLPLHLVISALINQLPGLVILLLGVIALRGEVHLSWLLIPLLILPQFLITAGLAFFVAGTSPIIRDIKQFTSLGTLCWMFLTPIFYPETIFRGRLAIWVFINPLAAIIHNYRSILLEGVAPDWGMFFYPLFLGLLLYLAGYRFFARTKNLFADLI